MDVDKEDSDGDDCEEHVDEDDREAPSEQDTDEVASKGESEHMEVRDDECESIHTQTSPRGFGWLIPNPGQGPGLCQRDRPCDIIGRRAGRITTSRGWVGERPR